MKYYLYLLFAKLYLIFLPSTGAAQSVTLLGKIKKRPVECRVDNTIMPAQAGIFIKVKRKNTYILFTEEIKVTDARYKKNIKSLKREIKISKRDSEKRLLKTKLAKVKKKQKLVLAFLTRKLTEFSAHCVTSSSGNPGPNNDPIPNDRTVYDVLNKYQLHILPSLGDSFALAINERGVAVGAEYIPGSAMDFRSVTFLDKLYPNVSNLSATSALAWKSDRTVRVCSKTFCGNRSIANDINDSGMIVGQFGTSVLPGVGAFSSNQDGNAAELKGVENSPARVFQINNKNQIAGYSNRTMTNEWGTNEIQPVPTLWDNFVASELRLYDPLVLLENPIEQSIINFRAQALDNYYSSEIFPARDVVGVLNVINDKSDYFGFLVHLMRYKITLKNPDNSLYSSQVDDIFRAMFNSVGGAISVISPHSSEQRFWSEQGKNKAIPAIPSDAELWQPTKMNNSGVTIGAGIRQEGTLPYTYRNNVRSVLSDFKLGQNFDVPMSINDSEDIVGYSRILESTSNPTKIHAVGKIAGTFMDLNSLLPSTSTWILEFASDINQCGMISGQAMDKKTLKRRAFILTPKSCLEAN